MLEQMSVNPTILPQLQANLTQIEQVGDKA